MEISIAMNFGGRLHGLSSNSYVQFSMLQICESINLPTTDNLKWTSINLTGSEIRPSSQFRVINLYLGVVVLTICKGILWIKVAFWKGIPRLFQGNSGLVKYATCWEAIWLGAPTSYQYGYITPCIGVITTVTHLIRAFIGVISPFTTIAGAHLAEMSQPFYGRKPKLWSSKDWYPDEWSDGCRGHCQCRPRARETKTPVGDGDSLGMALING